LGAFVCRELRRTPIRREWRASPAVVETGDELRPQTQAYITRPPFPVVRQFNTDGELENDNFPQLSGKIAINSGTFGQRHFLGDLVATLRPGETDFSTLWNSGLRETARARVVADCGRSIRKLG
jgi:hypothetical protein